METIKPKTLQSVIRPNIGNGFYINITGTKNFSSIELIIRCVECIDQWHGNCYIMVKFYRGPLLMTLKTEPFEVHNEGRLLYDTYCYICKDVNKLYNDCVVKNENDIHCISVVNTDCPDVEEGLCFYIHHEKYSRDITQNIKKFVEDKLRENKEIYEKDEYNESGQSFFSGKIEAFNEVLDFIKNNSH